MRTRISSRHPTPDECSAVRPAERGTADKAIACALAAAVSLVSIIGFFCILQVLADRLGVGGAAVSIVQTLFLIYACASLLVSLALIVGRRADFAGNLCSALVAAPLLNLLIAAAIRDRQEDLWQPRYRRVDVTV